MTPKPSNAIAPVAAAPDDFAGLPPWMAQMRRAAINCISEDDIRQIVANQVERAKKGDAAALTFIFDKVLGGGLKGATFIQNNYPADDRPDKPTAAIPGSPEKIEQMRRRVASGNGVFPKMTERNLD